MRLSILMFALLFALGGICGTHEDLYPDDSATPCNEANEGYKSGERNDGGYLMLPGANCLRCHGFGAAGTAFLDADGDKPLEDAIIRLTDAEGTIVETTTYESGNFIFGSTYDEVTLVFPVTAEIEVDGAIAAMIEPVETGACNSCHRCDGEAGAKLHGP